MELSRRVILSLALGASGNGQPREIWVDHDGGWEDIAAIAMLLRSADIKVMGIATTPGIADGQTAVARLGQLLAAMQIRDVALSQDFPDGADILATGPLTRIAQMLRKGKRPKSLTWMGGTLGAKAEWNAAADGRATQAVFADRLPLTLCPLELTNQFPSEAEVIEASGTPVVGEIRKAYGESNRYFWDELAAGWLIAPGLYQRQTMQLMADRGGRIRRVGAGGRTVTMLTGCDRAGFHALLRASLRF